jgi:hypothetical protein
MKVQITTLPSVGDESTHIGYPRSDRMGIFHSIAVVGSEQEHFDASRHWPCDVCEEHAVDAREFERQCKMIFEEVVLN